MEKKISHSGGDFRQLLDIEHLTTGNYTLVIQLGKQKFVQKWVKI